MEEELIEPIIYYNFDYRIEIGIENFFLDNQYPTRSVLSENDSYLLGNKMYGEFVRTHNIQLGDFPVPESCPVCMCSDEEIDRRFYFKTQCAHVFCAGCIAGVVLNKSMSCPLCRTDMVFEMFKYTGDVNSDPEPEPVDVDRLIYNFSLEEQEDDLDFQNDNYDQTLYEIFLEYWRSYADIS